MKHVARAFCAAVFLVGLLVFSQAQNTKQADSAGNDYNDVEPARSCIVKSIQYRVNQDGSKKIMTRYTTYHKANGEFRQVSYGPDGPKSDNLLSKYSNDTVIYAGLADGVYARGYGTNSLFYISRRAKSDDQMSKDFRSSKYYMDNRDLVRTDTIAGLKVYVLRQEVPNPESDIQWVEDSYSPKTGFGALREIVHFRDGSEVISEALSVEFTEVPEDLNDDLKGLPISNLEEKIRKQSQN
ncbi:MAG: hypothetical protein WBV94_07545 [Blastocatellia bacterium]